MWYLFLRRNPPTVETPLPTQSGPEFLFVKCDPFFINQILGLGAAALSWVTLNSHIAGPEVTEVLGKRGLKQTSSNR